MARTLRLEFEGALYHITSRGNRRETIYETPDDRERFLEILGGVREKYNWLCHAYCLMGNHYHLLIETPEANLSKGMRQLNGVYTQCFNKAHARVGHVFQGRYKAILVEKETYLLELARYIVLNPVRAGMVSSPSEWPWSSYRATAGEIPPLDYLSTDWLLSVFGVIKSQAQIAYVDFVSNARSQSSPWEDLKGQIYLGSDQFFERMLEHLGEPDRLSEVPAAQRRAEALPLKTYFGKTDNRNAVIAEAYASGGYTLKEIGDYLGLSYSRVSRIAKEYKSKT
ncbi:REP-associated tyrosine transposase [Marinobacter confluentis]|uniref:Addiction module toxin RelE n=1 Tax=Marinobacter confluentis TaxID=1697557 RepID=A0A4Z1C1H1_9GAMM|nr:transposase [Marinobacter confluentis]TGN38852.1 addiction module toxin RelE [Marinobacter confluentis]